MNMTTKFEDTLNRFAEIVDKFDRETEDPPLVTDPFTHDRVPQLPLPSTYVKIEDLRTFVRGARRSLAMVRSSHNHALVRLELMTADLADDATYTRIINLCAVVLEIEDNEIATALGVSRPTVARWMNSITRPHPAAREPVRRFFMKRLDEIIENERRHP